MKHWSVMSIWFMSCKCQLPFHLDLLSGNKEIDLSHNALYIWMQHFIIRPSFCLHYSVDSFMLIMYTQLNFSKVETVRHCIATRVCLLCFVSSYCTFCGRTCNVGRAWQSKAKLIPSQPWLTVISFAKGNMNLAKRGWMCFPVADTSWIYI